MYQNKKSRSGNFGLKKDLNGHSRKAFSTSYYTSHSNAAQCKQCGSDYMRFSLSGKCQRCLQHSEYLFRERPQYTLAANGGRLR